MRILLIEDDKETVRFLLKALGESGHASDAAGDGEEGLVMAREGQYDVLVVDRMLPHRDGLAVVRTLRAEGIRTPVLFLSALGEVDDRVKGLKAGADDYLTKPFAMSELLARVEALVRRAQPEEADPRYLVGDLMLDRLSRKVTRSGQPISLQPREFRLLEYLIRHPGEVVTRAQLLDEVWDHDLGQTTRTVDNHILRLRKHIEPDPENPRYIRTVRGTGYLFDPDPRTPVESV